MKDFNKDKYTFVSTVAIVDIGEKAVKLREKQIAIFLKELLLFKVLLKDLVGHSPSYKNKTVILNLAYYIIEDTEMLERIFKKKELPLRKLERETRASRAFLEIWQDYILAYIIILSNPNYKYIQDFLKIELKEEKTTIALYENTKERILKGLALKVNEQSAIIMTVLGDFVRIKKTEQLMVGEVGQGKKKRGVTDYKLHIAIAIILIMLVSFGLYKDYNKVVTTVVISSTSQIKLELNRGNTIIYIHTVTDKGNAMISSVEPMDKNIDIGLKELIEYAKNDKMIPGDGIVVTIIGEPLKYGILKETAQYIKDNDISIQINNDGNLHNIYELAD
ncbi:anti-sigma factor domain-containing protein [Clostridium vincentii]|uniref:RNA polymerase sigma factor SigI n=1 Tax=Clostridium vincentii TaxID=52704 RepID=A0A2T0BFU8_9CLOT|nr:anti-sigma factor domain-containing protein [Clostridium vincentii]PRR82702.1 RNA polymerase sigma factor SigI [Clostridium vincentii]